MTRLSIFLTILLTIIITKTINAADVHLANKNTAIEDQYIVVFDEQRMQRSKSVSVQEVVLSKAASLQASYRVKVLNTINKAVPAVVVKANPVQLKQLKKNRDIKYIEQDQVVTINQTDTQYNATWGLDRIDQRNVPLNMQYKFQGDGTNINAYILDTGVRITHSEFAPGRASYGYNATNNTTNASDCNGHGTHVAGTVGGKVYGVAKDVNIIAVKVFPNCDLSTSYSTVIKGIDWVLQNNNGLAVVNMSLSGGFSQTMNNAVQSLVDADIVVVVSAGNQFAADACDFSPPSAANVITVGASTNSDVRSDFSNIGTCVNVFAPGSSISAASNLSDTGIVSKNGTSMAAPHVAGIAALYREQDPTLSALQVKDLIINNSTADVLTNIGSGSPNLLVNSILPSHPWEKGSSYHGGVIYPYPVSGYALGYNFIPQADGKIVELGGLFDGLKTLRLFNRTSGVELASAQVYGTSADGFDYTWIEPVQVQQGEEYTVAVYMDTATGKYQLFSNVIYPTILNDIKIIGVSWADISFDHDARPLNNYVSGVMYGMPDIGFEKTTP